MYKLRNFAIITTAIITVATLILFRSPQPQKIANGQPSTHLYQRSQQRIQQPPDIQSRPDNGRRPLGELVVIDNIQPTHSVAVRDLPPFELVVGLDREINPRFNLRPAPPNPNPISRVKNEPDPLLALQNNAPQQTAMAFGTPILNFEGHEFTGVGPADANGDIGINYYIQAVNGGDGAIIQILNKADGSLVSKFELDSLGSGYCSNGYSDPIVLFDQMAERWLLTEMSKFGKSMCIYVSQTADPLGAYHAYQIESPDGDEPDYPKFAVWSDAYYASTNEWDPTIYAFDRSAMLNGEAASFQSFELDYLIGFIFQSVTPVDHDGVIPPPPGGYFMRHRDNEIHANGNCPDPDDQDCIEMWQFTPDFDDPNNTTLIQLPDIGIHEIDSEFCGHQTFECFPSQIPPSTLIRSAK